MLLLHSALLAASLTAGTGLALPADGLPRRSGHGGIAIPIQRMSGTNDRELARRDTSGSGPLTLMSLMYYTIPAAVGTPAQDMSLFLNLRRKAGFRLFTGGPPAFPELQNLTWYSPGNSSTFKNTSTTDDMGTVGTDTVSVAGFTFSDQAFYATDNGTYSGIALFTEAAGILYMGLESESSDFGDPYWKKVVAQGGAPETGIFLQPHDQLYSYSSSGSTPLPTSTGVGEIMFGGTNSKYYSGDIHYSDIVNTTEGQSGYINIQLDGVKINGESLPPVNGTVTSAFPTTDGSGNYTFEHSIPGPAAVSMFTSSLILPNSTLTALMAKIPGSQYAGTSGFPQPSRNYDMWSVPCNTNATVAFTIGGIDYALESVDLVLRDDDSSICYAALMSSQQYPISLSTTFMQRYYTVLKHDTNQVGFAKLADGIAPYNSTTNATGVVTGGVVTATGSAVPSTTTKGKSGASAVAGGVPVAAAMVAVAVAAAACIL